MELLKRVRDALLTITEDPYHFEAENKGNRYIVWQEDGEEESLYADDRHVISPVIWNPYNTKRKQDTRIMNGASRCRDGEDTEQRSE